MYNFIIVDDESVVRVTLSTAISWENHGFYLADSFSNGKAALEYLKENPVDLVLTDIKMPIMDGLQLMEAMEQLEKPPVVTVLSTYSEFDLVRQAFKLGARDYILKADMGPEVLTAMATATKELLDGEKRKEPVFQPAAVEPHEVLREMALGSRPVEKDFFHSTWCLACIEIDDFYREVLRFDEDLTQNLWVPLQGTAQQIPRVRNKCVLAKLSYSRYLLYLGSDDATVKEMVSICEQLQRVWKTYLNLSFSIGVSFVSSDYKKFPEQLLFSTNQVTKKFVFGRGGIFPPELENVFSVERAMQTMANHQPYLDSLRHSSPSQRYQAEQNFYAQLYDMNIKEAQELALQVVYGIALMLSHDNDALWNVFEMDENTDFYQKIARLDTVRSVEIWMTNFTGWISSYIEEKQQDVQLGEIELAKKFIHQNYTDPGINITAIAEHVGFSEKYFSTIFNERMGTSFLSYLNELRISMAKRLLITTDMKMYEISDAIGYNSVEHFTRVFKRVSGLTPTQYRKEIASEV